MYEQSIPAIAYVFIGITSLAVTYSQLMKSQSDNESVVNEQSNTTWEEEKKEESIEPTVPVSSLNTIEPNAPIENNTAQQMSTSVPMAKVVPLNESVSSVPMAKVVPLNESVSSINKGGKQKKRSTSQKTKSIQKVKKSLKKYKTRKNTKAK